MRHLTTSEAVGEALARRLVPGPSDAVEDWRFGCHWMVSHPVVDLHPIEGKGARQKRHGHRGKFRGKRAREDQAMRHPLFMPLSCPAALAPDTAPGT